MSDALKWIDDYLNNGGLFNPELANHEAVRDLLIKSRDEAIAEERERIAKLCSDTANDYWRLAQKSGMESFVSYTAALDDMARIIRTTK